eukprot:10465070-Alexandrium_andersonii.AAC.1
MDDKVDAVGQPGADAHPAAVGAEERLVDPRPLQLADRLRDSLRVVLVHEGALGALRALAPAPLHAGALDDGGGVATRRSLAAGRAR